MIKVENLTKSYRVGKTTVYALKNINLELEGGKIYVVLGPSGSGKTTLLNIVGGIDTADSGRVIVDGIEITRLSPNELTNYRRKKLGFVFQFTTSLAL